jgi:CHAT domain-containing protein
MLKLEALRQAQLALLNNALSGSINSQARGIGLMDTDENSNNYPFYSHPYFWASFILIGNWK